jgi:hypothetical protein
MVESSIVRVLICHMLVSLYFAYCGLPTALGSLGRHFKLTFISREARGRLIPDMQQVLAFMSDVIGPGSDDYGTSVVSR